MRAQDGSDHQPSEDSIEHELAYLEKFLGHRPGATPIVLTRLGELGAESKAQWPVLLEERRVRVKRLAARRRQQAATRAAALAMLVAGAPALGLSGVAQAAEVVSTPASSDATVASGLLGDMELRVMDRTTGRPLPGVRLQTAAEELVAVTDANGRALVPQRFASEPVLTLEREGYPMVLIEGQQLSNRSLITMKHFSGGPAWAKARPAWPDPSLLATNHVPVTIGPAPKKAAPKPMLASAHPAAHVPAAAHQAAPHHAPIELAAVPTVHPVLQAPKPAEAVPVKPQVAAALPHAAPGEHHADSLNAHPAAQPAAPQVARAPVPQPAADAIAPVRAVVDLEPAGHIPDAPMLLPSPVPIMDSLPAPVAIAAVPQAAPTVTAATTARPGVTIKLPARSSKAATRIPAPPKLPVESIASAAGTHTPGEPVAPMPEGNMLGPIAPAKLPMPEPARRPEPTKVQTAYATIMLPRAPRPARHASGSMGSIKAPRLALSMPSAAHARSAAYTVRSGDMLCTIAERMLGSADRWSEIYYANRDKLTNPRWLQVGIVLSIPHGLVGGNVYVVKPGDSLSLIALRLLGHADRWHEIYANNRSLIRNPRMIFPGQRLVMPGGGRMAEGAQPSIAWATLQASDTPPG